MALNVTHHTLNNNSINCYEPILELEPSDKDLAKCKQIRTAYNALIGMGLATCQELASTGHCGVHMSVNWAVIKFGKHTIPTPLSVDTVELGLLPTSANHAVAMSDEERAYANAVYYLETLRSLSVSWKQCKRQLSPSMVEVIQPAVRWMKNLPNDDHQSILHAVKSKLPPNVWNAIN